MKSAMAETLRLKYAPVAVSWTDVRPEGALSFKPGKRGCVMSLFARAAKGGRACADRETCGCNGAITGFCFGDGYAAFPGGVEGFYGFLSTGNGHTPGGRRMGEAMTQVNRNFGHHYLYGECYKKSPDLVRLWHQAMPIRQAPGRWIFLRPLADVQEGETPDLVIFTVTAEQLSSLVILANYGSSAAGRVAIPFGSGCQQLVLLPMREAEREEPGAVVGLTDLTARRAVMASLGRDMLTFAMPWRLFVEMEADTPGCFFERGDFRTLSAGDAAD